MKRLIAMLLAAAILVSMVPAAAAAGFEPTETWSDTLFGDVSQDDWFYDTVKNAYELGLMTGYGNGSFLPGGEITLAETVTIAARIHAVGTGAEADFVQGTPWYQVYVDYALEQGILTGELSDYGRAATRLEFAEILAKALPVEALPVEALPAINNVADGAIPDVADNADVYMLYRAGVLTGNDSIGTFSPNATIVRREVAAIVARMAVPELRQSVSLPAAGSTGSYDVTGDLPAANVPSEEESEEVNGGDISSVPFDLANPDLFASGEVDYSGEQILIKLAAAPTAAQQKALQEAGVTALEDIMNTSDAVWYKAQISGDVTEVMAAVRALSFVKVAEYDYAYKSDAQPVDTGISGNGNNGNGNNGNGNNGNGNGNGNNGNGNGSNVEHHKDQWYLDECGIKKGWYHVNNPHYRPGYDEDGDGNDGGGETDGVEAGNGIVVAVIDTGVDYTHEDLKDSMWVNTDEIPNNGKDDDKNGYVDDYYGWDAVARKGSGMDDNGHGTHVAGIIAASNNNLGIVGIAYNAKIMPIKAGQASGYFNQSDIAAAIMYACENGADVINMSFGGSASSLAVQEALEYAYTYCVLVAAAGNDGKPNEATDYYDPAPTYPAAYSYVLGVMSVDENGTESNFTNWDVTAFNGTEYEVYAPGEAMISTIPGDRYATWSGTSMAAPVVSAIAALVRSEFRDLNTYPTKFIYGQICGTGDETAACIDPEKHTVGGKIHDLPQIVDVYNALTVMPQPDVSVTDYTLFDTAGLRGNAKNNGDGVIDAGETVALGFTLRNKWGKSTGTVITVDAMSQAGIPDPYITIHNPSVSVGEVGTYSTNDCGKVMADGAHVGWETPIYITVSENCPNDYIFTLNVTVTCKNGLNAGDAALYSSTIKVNFDVRRGVILPNKITSDMTLTADNFYIIPNATLIMEGATVTVEAGTRIQFWSDDPNDAYADTAITYLNVEGTLICNGTAENPVELFPSERMGQYRVEITEKNNGVVKLFYTDVVNPYLTDITYAEGCEFSQMYPGTSLNYRYLSSGSVKTSVSYATVVATKLQDCAFYRLGYSGKIYTSHIFQSSGAHYNCIFVDCAAELEGSYNSCLFYGNNNYQDAQDGIHGLVSTRVTSTTASGWSTNNRVFTDPATGNSYASMSVNSLALAERFAALLGGHLAILETEAELEFVRSKVYSSAYGTRVRLGLIRDYRDDSLRWVDGSLPGSFVDLTVTGSGSVGGYNLTSHVFTLEDAGSGLYLIEIPAAYVEEITLDRYAVTLDTAGAGWQISAAAAPSGVVSPLWVYRSMDESVAVVNDFGYVTPVGEGSTEIRVYSPDLAVYNTLNVTVVGEVMLESLSLGEAFRLPVGGSRALTPVFTPAHTSKQYLVYTSDCEAVATVDASGRVTAHAVGTAMITATNPETGISASVTVEGYVPVASVTVEDPLFATHADTAETVSVLGVTVSPANATYPQLIWESSNPEILEVDEAGNLVKHALGTATLRATSAENPDLYAEVTVALTEVDTAVTVVQMEYFMNETMALLDDGSLWVWGYNIDGLQKVSLTDEAGAAISVRRFDVGYSGKGYYLLLVLNDSGELNAYRGDGSSAWTLYNEILGGSSVSGVTDVTTSGYSFYYLKEDGSVWCWGYNNSGQLGIGSKVDQTTLVRMFTEYIDGKVVDIESNYLRAVYLLTEAGDVYYVGYVNNSYSALVPTYYDSGVVALHQNVQNDSLNRIGLVALEYEDKILPYLGCSTPIVKQGVLTRVYTSNINVYYIGEDRAVYAKGNNQYGQLGNGTTNSSTSNFTQVKKVKNAVNIFSVNSSNETVYIQTADGKFYGMGYSSSSGEIPNLTSGNQLEPSRIYFGLTKEPEAPALEGTNLEEAVLNDTILELDFDRALTKGSEFVNITLEDSISYRAMTATIKLDKLVIQPVGKLTPGETYTLTIPASAFTSKFNVPNEALTLTFTAGEGAAAPETGTTPAPEEGTAPAPEVVNVTTPNPEFTGERTVWTEDTVKALWEEFRATSTFNWTFCNNAIVNRLNEDNVEKWLRVQASESSSHSQYPLGYNWWGTTNERLIDKQILDFDDYQTLGDLVETPYLTAAPADVWPFAVDAWLENSRGERVDTIGNEQVTFCVQFNRAMDTSVELDVRFGSTYPYADYALDGAWVTPTLWKGSTTLTTLIEAGYQYWSIDNGRAADNHALTLYKDWGRFPFEIDTTSALAMALQGNATDTGVELTWFQDDFDTLMGYNVYRADQDVDGYYQRLNSSVIPFGTEEFFDDTVEPGKVYYYTFRVVKTDLSESAPSGKIRILSKDTMAPVLYHTPVYQAYAGSNVVLSATATDNLGLSAVTLHYRAVGSAQWTDVKMTALNDKYSAIISGGSVTLAGVEYYITASDGVSTVSRGSAEQPYTIVVQEDPGEMMLGDVNTDGRVTLVDALMVLRARNGKILLEREQFDCADLDGNGVLTAEEALRILKYANGEIGSLRID